MHATAAEPEMDSLILTPSGTPVHETVLSNTETLEKSALSEAWWRRGTSMTEQNPPPRTSRDGPDVQPVPDTEGGR